MSLTGNPLLAEAVDTLDIAKAMPTVKTDEDYRFVCQVIMDAKRLIAKIKEAHKPSIQAAHESHKAAIALCDSHIEPILHALRIVEPLALAYKQQKDREAKALAEAERQGKEAVALAEAEWLELQGFSEEAEAKLAETVAPTRITPLQSTLPKVEGLSTRKRWTYRLVDPRAVKREFCVPAEARIKSKVENEFYKISQVTPEMIRILEDEIGGIEVMEVETMVGRTK